MVTHCTRNAYVDYAGIEVLMETIALSIIKFGRSSLCMVVLQQTVNKCITKWLSDYAGLILSIMVAK